MNVPVFNVVKHIFLMEIATENIVAMIAILKAVLEMFIMIVNNGTSYTNEVTERSFSIKSMQQDFEFELAQKTTKLLFDNNFITFDEYTKICNLNKESFDPFYKELL